MLSASCYLEREYISVGPLMASIVIRAFNRKTRKVHVYDFTQVSGVGLAELGEIRIMDPTLDDLRFADALEKLRAEGIYPVDTEGRRT